MRKQRERKSARCAGRRYGPSSKNEANQRPSVCKAVCYVERQISYVTGFEKRKATVSICKKHTHIRMEYVFVILEETNVIDNINHIEFK